MTKPLNIHEQTQQNWFQPRYRLAFYFGINNYDACWKRNKQGELVQAMPDLPGAEQDCEMLRMCLEKYQIRESDVFWFGNNPTGKELGDAFDKLSKRLREGKRAKPAETYLVIMLFAGYGILKDGMQVVL